MLCDYKFPQLVETCENKDYKNTTKILISISDLTSYCMQKLKSVVDIDHKSRGTATIAIFVKNVPCLEI
jgi:hypothetical protein